MAGFHDVRMDGMTDLVVRARGASVLDIGCNRGLVGFEMANNGARLIHGCDIFSEGIRTARELFADLRAVESRFEVTDLTGGPASLNVFGDRVYDIVLMLATYHKLKRVMAAEDLAVLMLHLADRTGRYFGWRATSRDGKENWREMKRLDAELAPAGLYRIHTSLISEELGLCAIWSRARS